MALQLDIFEPSTDLFELRQTLAEVKVQSDNTRRGLFARYNDLSKLYIKQHAELEILRQEFQEWKKRTWAL